MIVLSDGQEIESRRVSSMPVSLARRAGAITVRRVAVKIPKIDLLSVNLAVLNLLPIPMLDGGHLFVMGIEAVVRRDLPVRQKEVLQQIGFVLLLVLMVYVTANDIGRALGLN